MEKKLYIIPLVEVEKWNMRDVMKASGTSPDLPDGPSSAPKRVPTLSNDSVRVF